VDVLQSIDRKLGSVQLWLTGIRGRRCGIETEISQTDLMGRANCFREMPDVKKVVAGEREVAQFTGEL
jgi:hypothetical protein